MDNQSPNTTLKKSGKMSPVVHFEMPYIDKGRMADFYAKTFGWQAQMLGPEMGYYVVVETSEKDPASRFPKNPGRINGGFFKKTKETQYPSVVISVEDIWDGIKKVEEMGGKILGGEKPGKPDDIPGIGLYISFEDTEGNRVGMLQPVGM